MKAVLSGGLVGGPIRKGAVHNFLFCPPSTVTRPGSLIHRGDTDSNDSDLISPEEMWSINITSLRYADPKKVIKRMKGIPFSCAPNCVCKGPQEERRMRGPQASASCQTVLSPRFARTSVDCFEPARSHKGERSEIRANMLGIYTS